MGNQNEYPNKNGNGSNGITYRYFNDRSNIVIPFGFGLSYTQFKYSNLTLNITKSNKNNKNINDESRKIKKNNNKNASYDYVLDDPCAIIGISFNVENVGKYDGDEVIQAYVKQLNASVPVPNIRLGDFERIDTIKVNETRKVSLVLTPRYRSVVYNESSPNWYTPDIRIESGVFSIYVGGGQPGDVDTLETNVLVTKNSSFYSCENQD